MYSESSFQHFYDLVKTDIYDEKKRMFSNKYDILEDLKKEKPVTIAGKRAIKREAKRLNNKLIKLFYEINIGNKREGV